MGSVLGTSGEADDADDDEEDWAWVARTEAPVAAGVDRPAPGLRDSSASSRPPSLDVRDEDASEWMEVTSGARASPRTAPMPPAFKAGDDDEDDGDGVEDATDGAEEA